MKISINVENIRCGGCANTITKKLMSLESVNSVDIVIEDQVITIDSNDKAARPIYIETLYANGLP
ncbi:MAG: heavy-metal-associated domain-containing protein [Gammaproteobacteria bacterium]|nr:heavy-metal-associated domain-containing protein [Gammaproteobacteria bacterium]